jgi:NADH:ubiquinone oxidoreductase subunit 3 (subunit A)
MFQEEKESMMNIGCSIAVGIAFAFSLLALSISYLSRLLPTTRISSSCSYECGFSGSDEGFVYQIDFANVIPLFIIMETIVISFLILVSFREHIVSTVFRLIIVFLIVILLAISFRLAKLFQHKI